MTRWPAVSLALSLALLPVSAPAQEIFPPDDSPEEGEVEEGFDLIEEGSKLLLRGLVDQIEPFMDDLATEMEPKLRAFANDFMPLMEEFSDMIGDLNNYYPPEKLPNGDIILRRKTPLSPDAPDEDEVDI
jgi:hypothetical protein